MDRNDFIENIIGGGFAIISIGAAIVEMFINGISNDTIVACIKDVFSSLAIVVLFIAIVKDRIPSRNFRKSFDRAMESVIKKYGELIRKEELSITNQTANTKTAIAKKDKLDKVICYDMAADINVLFGSHCNNYPRFLEIQTNDTTQIKLLIRKTFFNHQNYSETTLTTVGRNIERALSKNFADYEIMYDEKSNNILVDLKRLMRSDKDAIELVKIVDAATMLYIAESKK